jgi:hypothetical protein
VSVYGVAPSGPPLQSMGGRDRSVWTTDGYWYPWRHPFPNVAYHCYFTSPAGGHTDAYHVFEGVDPHGSRRFIHTVPDRRSWWRRLVDRILRRSPPAWVGVDMTSGGNSVWFFHDAWVHDAWAWPPVSHGNRWADFKADVADELRATDPPPDTAAGAQDALADSLGRVARRRGWQ